MGLNRMTGVPWHIETLHRKGNEPRRHRSRCEYFDRNSEHCSRRNGRCIGSAHCMEYEEKGAKVNGKKSINTNKNSKPSKMLQTTKQKDAMKYQAYKKVGTKVRHVKYGIGKVIKADEEHITIHFEDGYESKFGLQISIEKGFVKLL